MINVTGLYIAPGFIDLHTHVFTGMDPRIIIGNLGALRKKALLI